MKRICTMAIALAVFISAAIMVPAAAGSVDPPKPMQDIDEQVKDILPKLEAMQEEYFKAKGHYYQSLESHDQVPTTASASNKVSTKPTDQAEAVAFAYAADVIPHETAWSFHIDIYDGPNGPGYVLVIRAIADGKVWQRSINHGLEWYRDEAWAPVIADEPGPK